MELETLAVHAGYSPDPTTNAVAVPIYQTTAYAFDKIYRHEHHGDTVAPLSGWGMAAQEFATPELGALTTLIDDGDVLIEALAVGHAPVEPAVGYRFKYKDRSLLITGDTIATDNIVAMSKGIDLQAHLRYIDLVRVHRHAHKNAIFSNGVIFKYVFRAI